MENFEKILSYYEMGKTKLNQGKTIEEVLKTELRKMNIKATDSYIDRYINKYNDYKSLFHDQNSHDYGIQIEDMINKRLQGLDLEMTISILQEVSTMQDAVKTVDFKSESIDASIHEIAGSNNEKVDKLIIKIIEDDAFSNLLLTSIKEAFISLLQHRNVKEIYFKNDEEKMLFCCCAQRVILEDTNEDVVCESLGLFASNLFILENIALTFKKLSNEEISEDEAYNEIIDLSQKFGMIILLVATALASLGIGAIAGLLIYEVSQEITAALFMAIFYAVVSSSYVYKLLEDTMIADQIGEFLAKKVIKLKKKKQTSKIKDIVYE